MTLNKINKEIEKLESSNLILSRELNRNQSVETEKRIIKQKSIIYHLIQIKGILANS